MDAVERIAAERGVAMAAVAMARVPKRPGLPARQARHLHR